MMTVRAYGFMAIVVAASATACSLLFSADDLSEKAGQTGDGGPNNGGQNCDASFCRSFDDNRPLEADFVVSSCTGGGTTEIQTDESRSPPGSLLSTLPANSTASDCTYVLRRFEGSPSEIHLEADVLLEPDLPKEISIMEIYSAQNPADEQRIRIAFKNNTAGIREVYQLDAGTSANVAHGFETPAPTEPDGWYHIDILLKIGTQTTVSMVVGDTLVVDNDVLDPAHWKRLPPSLAIGITKGFNHEDEWDLSVRYDNIVFDMK